jgi:prepilin-type N-terminal cleavage/methylation domain-containing protein
MKIEASFTLIELLIVIALIAILATAAIILFNPMQQIGKSQDAKRKSDLNMLNKAFEEFYNDKGCYPTAADVCYDSAINEGSFFSCHICDKHPDFPYLNQLPCDPQSPKKEYYYIYNKETCPTWYHIYSKFSTKNDPQSISLGCQSGACGPAPRGYDYGVSSPNTSLYADTAFICLDKDDENNKVCITCGNSYAQCTTNEACKDYNQYYFTSLDCCNQNPDAINCSSVTKYCLSGTQCILCGGTLDCVEDERCNRPIHLYNNSSCI